MNPDKLGTLAEIEGYANVDDMLAAAAIDSVSPGICVNDGCDYTIEVEPDQQEGYCEECETFTVKSALVLAGLI